MENIENLLSLEDEYSSKMIIKFDQDLLKKNSGLSPEEAFEIIEKVMNLKGFSDMVSRLDTGVYATTTDDIGMLGRVCFDMPVYYDWFLTSLTAWLWVFHDHVEDCLEESLIETPKIKQRLSKRQNSDI